MKKIILPIVSLLITGEAFAANLMVDLKTEQNSKSYFHSDRLTSSRFTFRTARLDLKGTFNENLKYRLRTAFNDDALKNSVDGIQDTISLAYIEHSLNDGFTLTAGKLNTLIGGYESSTTAPDMYLRSQAYNVSSPQGGLDTELGSLNDLLYLTGAKMAYEWNNQSLTYVVANNYNDARSKNTHGLIWNAKLNDKSVLLNASWHMAEGLADGDVHNYYDLGVSLTSGRFNMATDLHYIQGEQDATGNEDSIKSIYSQMGYVLNDKFKARLDLQYSWLDFGIISNGQSKRWEYAGFNTAIEYYPHPGTMFRYYASYGETHTQKAPAGELESVEKEVAVGFRLLADLLK